MRIVFILIVLVFIGISTLFISYQDQHTPMDTKPLHKVQNKFLAIDINDENLDLEKAIKEVKEARKLYPLDDKLKMVDMELEHRLANQNH